MKSEKRFMILLILSSAAVGAFLFGIALWIVQLADEFDSKPRGTGVKSQLMRRKSDLMHEILDDMVTGNLDRVHSAAKRMKTLGETIDTYLASETYDAYSDDFNQSLDKLAAAAAENDFEKAKEATLILEKSCIECHMLLNARKASGE